MKTTYKYLYIAPIAENLLFLNNQLLLKIPLYEDRQNASKGLL